ncbi:MAG: hypothetical protein C4321_01155 [Chloroflexota bacterium]
MHRPDAIRVHIAQDGTLTITTDDISMPNHREADDLLNLLNQLAGGQTEVIERPERLLPEQHQDQSHLHDSHRT